MQKIPINEFRWSELAQNYPELLRPQLEARLIKRVDVDQLASDITQILKPLGKKPGTPETVARRVATVLAPRFAHVSTDLDRLIANRPGELAAALDASDFEEYRKLAKIVSKFSIPKRTRSKQLTEEQKRKNVKASKNRYERRKRRRYNRLEVGLIEEEFGTHRFPSLFPDAAPTGPCLDTLLNYGGVPMSGGADSLERLFGIDRHKLTKSLPRFRRGRRFFYDLRAVLECIHELLETGRWLVEVERRKLVLSGIVKRANDIGKPKVPTLLETFFRQYLV
jgi:hypothetical protein